MIKIQDIRKKYKKFELSPVSFALQEGTVTALIGPNGAGKSTLIKIMSGLKKADAGKIIIDGKDVKNLSKNVKLGYLSQELEIYPDVKLKNITHFVSRAYGKHWSESKFTEYFRTMFQLDDSMRVKELSTGMRVKYFLALELAKQPDVLILDEPTSGLDPMAREEVLEILQKLSREEGVTILFSSHITEKKKKIGDRVVYLYNGKILIEDTKEKIKEEYIQIFESERQKMPSDWQNIVLSEGVKIQDYYVCNCKRNGVLKQYGKEALLSDVLIFLKEAVKCD